MAEIEDLDPVDANNNGTAANAGFPENMSPSAVNDAARALEGMVARWYADTNGSIVSAGTDTVTLAASRTISAYAQGQVFIFEAGGANTGAVTLNVDSVGAKAIVKNYNAALAANDIKAGQIVAVAYEASADNFQMLSHLGNASSGGDMVSTNNLSDVADAPTSFSNIKQAASATATGVVEIATQAEVNTGTDTTRSVTPETLDGFVTGKTDTVITASDEIVFADVTDSNAAKKDTVQGIIDLVSAGGLVYLASATASASATLDFTSNIDATYDNYLFILSDIVSASDTVRLYGRTTTNGGSTWDAGTSYEYVSSRIYAAGVSGTFYSDVSTGAAQLFMSSGVVGSAAGETVGGIVHLMTPASANYCKIMWDMSVTGNTSGDLNLYKGGGRHKTAQNVDGFRFLMSSGNIASGTIRLYGIVNS
jgi:hypothetical protein